MSKKIIYIDMDDTACVFRKQWHVDKEANPDIEYPQSVPGFFLKLEPIEYFLSCVAMLEDSGEYEVWFATAPSIKNLHCYTEKATWINKYLGEEYLERLFIAPDKSKLIGDFLVDDCDKGKGQDKFQGELIHFGSDKWPTWIDITNYLLEKLKV